MKTELDTSGFVFSRNAQGVPEPTPYALRVTRVGELEYREGRGLWQPFDPQPPGEVSHLAADNNRVFVRLIDGSLHWCVLRTDIGSWVDLNFRVISDLVRTSSRVQSMLKAAAREFPVEEQLNTLFGVPDLWPDGRAPRPPSDLATRIVDWLAAYRTKLMSAHAAPQGARHGSWNRIYRSAKDGSEGPQSGPVADIAVGNWHHTVTTLFVLMDDGRILYLDEEPMMPHWRLVPGTESPRARRASGLYLSSGGYSDAILTASHSVLAVLQPTAQRVSWRRWDYHNPGDFVFFPLVNWTETAWNHAAIPGRDADAVSLDVSYWSPAGVPRPWEVPLPHPVVLHLRRGLENKILDLVRGFLTGDGLGAFLKAIAVMPDVLKFLRSLPADPHAPPLELKMDSEAQAIMDKVVQSPVVARLLADLRELEKEIWAQLDEPRVSEVKGEFLRRAKTLAANDMGTVMTLWTLIREAALRLDASTGRRSSVGAFGDNPIKPAGSYPIDLWVRTGDGQHFRALSANAGVVSSLSQAARALLDSPRPGTVTLARWWEGDAQPAGPGRQRRTLVAEVPEVLGANPLFDWSVQRPGQSMVTRQTKERLLRLTVDLGLGEEALIAVEGRDRAGHAIIATGTLGHPVPRLSLSVDLKRSHPFGIPETRPLEAADGSALSPTSVLQQGYSPIAIRVHGTGFGLAPYVLHWRTDHHQSGTETVTSFPVVLDIPSGRGKKPEPMVLRPDLFGPPSPMRWHGPVIGDPGGPPPLSIAAAPERFTLTVTVTDAAGGTAETSLPVNPWQPVRDPGTSGLPRENPRLRHERSRIDELETLADEGHLAGVEDIRTLLDAIAQPRPPSFPAAADLFRRVLSRVTAMRGRPERDADS